MMDKIDEILFARARVEPCPIPADYAGRVFQTLSALPKTEQKQKPARHPRRYLGWAAAVLAVLIAVPNVSPAAAAALSEIPVVGAIVKIVTLRSYLYDDGHSAADVVVPELSGSAAAETVNEQVRAYADQLIAQFQKDCESIGEGYQGLDITSSVMTDSEKWFTLRVDATTTQASGVNFSKIYHIDKATGAVVGLGSLFRADADYVTALSAEVKRQMETQMEKDENLAYFPEEFTAIEKDQNFYWNADGELVLVFDEYSVAAGSMGMPEFVIPRDVYQDFTK